MKVVYLNDTGIAYDEATTYFDKAAEWAKKQCPSFINYHVQDVSDASYTNDFITSYHFKDPKDALLFQLKWKSD